MYCFIFVQGSIYIEVEHPTREGVKTPVTENSPIGGVGGGGGGGGVTPFPLTFSR